MPAVKKTTTTRSSQSTPYPVAKKHEKHNQQVVLPTLPDSALFIDYTALNIHEQHSKMARIVVQCMSMLRNEHPTYSQLDVAYRALYPTSKVLSIRLYVQQWSTLAEKNGVPSVVHEEETDCMYIDGEYHRVCKCTGGRSKTRAVKLWIDESIPVFNTDKTIPPLSKSLLPKPQPKPKPVVVAVEAIPSPPAFPPSPSPSIPSAPSSAPSLCESSCEEDDFMFGAEMEFEQLPLLEVDVDVNMQQECQINDKDLLDFLLSMSDSVNNNVNNNVNIVPSSIDFVDSWDPQLDSFDFSTCI